MGPAGIDGRHCSVTGVWRVDRVRMQAISQNTQTPISHAAFPCVAWRQPSHSPASSIKISRPPPRGPVTPTPSSHTTSFTFSPQPPSPIATTIVSPGTKEGGILHVYYHGGLKTYMERFLLVPAPILTK